MAEKCFKFGLKGGIAVYDGYKGVHKKQGKYLMPGCSTESCDELED